MELKKLVTKRPSVIQDLNTGHPGRGGLNAFRGRSVWAGRISNCSSCAERIDRPLIVLRLLTDTGDIANLLTSESIQALDRLRARS